MIIKPNTPFNGIFNGEDVKKEVQEYMDLLMLYTDGEPYVANTVKHERVQIPEHLNVSRKSDAYKNFSPSLKKQWNNLWLEITEKMENGVSGMCGLQFGYFNFANFFGGKGSGKVSWRRHDNDQFELIEACAFGKSVIYPQYHKWGIQTVKRRREGWTSRAGWYLLERTRRMKNTNHVVTSKSEKDAQDTFLGQKTVFMYDNIPAAIRPTLFSRSKERLHFGEKEKDGAGNTVIKGRNTSIIAKAPTAERIESETLMDWIHDEAPKTRHLDNLVTYTLPALADEDGFDRDGFVMIGGVAGDFGKFGQDFITLWNMSEVNKFVRVFSPGWSGLNVDEYGNENIRENVEWILEQRRKILLSKASAEDKAQKIAKNRQMYPLTQQESFMSASGSILDQEAITKQLNYLNSKSISVFIGDIKTDEVLPRPIFEPNLEGKVKILQYPEHGAKYVTGIDAFGRGAEVGSKGAQVVLKLKDPRIEPEEHRRILHKALASEDPQQLMDAYLTLGHIPVAYYEERTKDPKQFAKNALALTKFFGQYMSDPLPMFVEKEPPIIYDWLLDNAFNYLAHTPLRSDEVPTPQRMEQKGVNMKKGYWEEKRMEYLGHYFQYYCRRVYFKHLLHKGFSYNPDTPKLKHDIIDGLAITLIGAQDPIIKAWIEKGIEDEYEDDQVGPAIHTYRRR